MSDQRISIDELVQSLFTKQGLPVVDRSGSSATVAAVPTPLVVRIRPGGSAWLVRHGANELLESTRESAWQRGRDWIAGMGGGVVYEYGALGRIIHAEAIAASPPQPPAVPLRPVVAPTPSSAPPSSSSPPDTSSPGDRAVPSSAQVEATLVGFQSWAKTISGSAATTREYHRDANELFDGLVEFIKNIIDHRDLLNLFLRLSGH